MHLPRDVLEEVLAAVVEVDGELEAYLARGLRGGAGIIYWDGLGWGGLRGAAGSQEMHGTERGLAGEPPAVAPSLRSSPPR